MIDCDESQTMVQHTKKDTHMYSCCELGKTRCFYFFWLLNCRPEERKTECQTHFIIHKYGGFFFLRIFGAMEIRMEIKAKAQAYKIHFLLFTFRFGHSFDGIIIWTPRKKKVETFFVQILIQSRPYQTYSCASNVRQKVAIQLNPFNESDVQHTWFFQFIKARRLSGASI